ncbi:Xaa-Pro peptidase family protein [Francisellaceae bacterium CB300]|jgi:Xaa-Pro dipeptidase
MISSTFSQEQITDFDHRHKSLQKKLKENNIKQFIITNPQSIFYLVGASFEALERVILLVFNDDGTLNLLVPTLEYSHLIKSYKISEENIVVYKEFPSIDGQNWNDILLNSNIIKDSSIAIENNCPLCVANLFPYATTVSFVDDIRTVKSSLEIEKIRVAAEYADLGVQYILNNTKYGTTTFETTASTNVIIQKAARNIPNLDLMVSKILCSVAFPAPFSGEPHSSFDLHSPLKEGPHVAIVLTQLNGYCAESERTFFTTEPSLEENEYFNLMLQAREIGFKMIKPGQKCSDIDEAISDFLKNNGIKDYHNRLHRVGHGFGLSNHERPWLAEGGKEYLEENMLVSMEPGIYIPKLGGFRHSDTILVTSDGAESLTKIPSDLESLILTRD